MCSSRRIRATREYAAEHSVGRHPNEAILGCGAIRAIHRHHRPWREEHRADKAGLSRSRHIPNPFTCVGVIRALPVPWPRAPQCENNIYWHRLHFSFYVHPGNGDTPRHGDAWARYPCGIDNDNAASTLASSEVTYMKPMPPNKQFQPTNSRCARICG